MKIWFSVKHLQTPIILPKQQGCIKPHSQSLESSAAVLGVRRVAKSVRDICSQKTIHLKILEKLENLALTCICTFFPHF